MEPPPSEVSQLELDVRPTSNLDRSNRPNDWEPSGQTKEPPSRWMKSRATLAEIIRTVALPFVLLMVTVIAVASSIGLLLTHTLADSRLVHWEQHLASRLEAGRTPRLTSATGVGTFFADPIPVAVVWVAAVLIFAVVTRHWRPPVFIMMAVGGEKLSYLLSTLVVRRPRPDVVTIGKVHVTSSFPSGHVGSSVSLYGSITVLIVVLAGGAWRSRLLWVPVVVAALFAIMVGYSRMYRGHHFLSDVIVGCAIGATWVVVSYRVVLRPWAEDHRPRATHRGTPVERLASGDRDGEQA